MSLLPSEILLMSFYSALKIGGKNKEMHYSLFLNAKKGARCWSSFETPLVALWGHLPLPPPVPPWQCPAWCQTALPESSRQGAESMPSWLLHLPPARQGQVWVGAQGSHPPAAPDAARCFLSNTALSAPISCAATTCQCAVWYINKSTLHKQKANRE